MTQENISALKLHDLLKEIRTCTYCKEHLPMGPRPVLRANASAKILVIGQAPGIRVHQSGIPWDDASGKRLRQWLGLPQEQFYDENNLAIVPMGFCYPGKGSNGDLPPRKECATLWHSHLLEQLPDVKLTLLIGAYSQQYYLQDSLGLTERVRQWQQYLPRHLPLVHPSPRNQRWLKQNPWFEAELVPALQKYIQKVLPGD